MGYRTGALDNNVSTPSTAPYDAPTPPYITACAAAAAPSHTFGTPNIAHGSAASSSTSSSSHPPSFLVSHLLRLLNALRAHAQPHAQTASPTAATKRLQQQTHSMAPDKKTAPRTEPAAAPAPADPAQEQGAAQAAAAYTTLPATESHSFKDVLCSAEARDVRAAGMKLLSALAAFVTLLLTVLVGYVEERQGVAKASQKDSGLAARCYGVTCRAAPGVQRVALRAGEFGVMVLAKMRSFSGPGAQSVVGPVARTVMGVLPDDARRAVRAACDDEDGSNK